MGCGAVPGLLETGHLSVEAEPSLARQPSQSLPDPHHIRSLCRPLEPPLDDNIFLELPNSSLNQPGLVHDPGHWIPELVERQHSQCRARAPQSTMEL